MPKAHDQRCRVDGVGYIRISVTKECGPTLLAYGEVGGCPIFRRKKPVT